MKKQLLLVIFVSVSAICIGGKPKRKLEAVRTNQQLKIDGFISEEAWKNVPKAIDFVTYSPTFGEPASQRTEVRVVYDNQAIYFGIMCFDTAPDSILKELTKRDERMGGNTDKFEISLNPYNDGQNLYNFEVTASNVQSDSKASNQRHPDMSWSTVWHSETKIVENGWIIEVEIPYSAIRFPKEEIQKWGVNFKRTVRRTREESTWNSVDRTFSEASQVGELYGISNIEAPLRLELYPYISAFAENREEGNSYGYSAGLDLKYGINESFTLDMTLIPDFGQRKSDNTVLNLTPFETRYEENRAFFNEGTEIFKKVGLFYSRRVGSEPSGYYDVNDSLAENEELIENPAEAKLINATKISGRNSNNLGIGFFNAMTANTYARISNPELEERKKLTEAFTNFNMLVLDQIIGQNSYVNLTNSNVIQPGSDKLANVTGTAIKIMDKENIFGITAKSAFSLKKENSYSKNRKGYFLDLNVGKFSGNFRYNYFLKTYSDDYDHNDLGYLSKNNYISHIGTFEYRVFEPVGVINNYSFQLSTAYNMVYLPRDFSDLEIGFQARTMFSNYWDIRLSSNIFPVEQYDYYESRIGDRPFVRPESVNLRLEGSTDYRKKLAFQFKLSADKDVDNREGYSYFISLMLRLTDKFSLKYDMEVAKMKNEKGYAEMISTDSIVFGNRNIDRLTNTLSSSYVFSNKSHLSLTARHYWSKVNYDQFYLLNNDGLINNFDSFEGDEDLNFNTFSVDLVYSWNFAPGSFLNLVWKNNIYNSGTILEDDFPNFRDNFRNTIRAAQTNTISVKFIYYFDYNKLKKS
ncbi:DUF5916 domain-containing protein [Bacteroidota bacterium]